jgi:hypothetical protein
MANLWACFRYNVAQLKCLQAAPAAMISKRFEVIFIFFFNKPTALRPFKRVSKTETAEYVNRLPF